MAKLRPESDMFELPPMQMLLDDENEESEIDDFLSSSDDSSPEKPCPIDLHSVDVNCEAFKSLPADIRHEILTDLKETRKQSSWGRLNEMPEESGDFSTFQMNRLLKRRNFQISLEETEKEMGGKTMSLRELEELLKDQGVPTNLDVGKRIASDSTTRFVYIQEAVKKSLLKPIVVSSSNNMMNTSRNTVVQSSRAGPKGDYSAPIAATTTEITACDKNEDTFNYDQTFGSSDDENGSATNSIEQPKTRIDLARDFMFVASALTHEQIHSILEKRNSPLKTKKSDVNNSMSEDTDLERSIAAIVGEADSRDVSSSGNFGVPSSSSPVSTVTGPSLEETKSSILEDLSDFDAGPSTSDIGTTSCIAGSNTCENEIDYIGIMSDDSESDESETVHGNEQKQSAPLEIVIQCDKEYKIEEDMFADIFYNIDSEKKNDFCSKVDNINVKHIEKMLNIDHESSDRLALHADSILNNDTKINACETTVTSETPTKIYNDSVQGPKVTYMNESKEIESASNLVPLEQNQLKPNISKLDSHIAMKETGRESLELKEDAKQRHVENELFEEENSSPELSIQEEESQETGRLDAQIVNNSSESRLLTIPEDLLHLPENVGNNCNEKSKPGSKPEVDSSVLEEADTASTKNIFHENFSGDHGLVSDTVTIGPLESKTGAESHSKSQEKINPEEEPAGTSAYFPSSSKFTTKQLQGIQACLESRHKDLLMEQYKKERMAANITDQMCSEAQELLKMFGLPYLVAPMEAEAQCAFLDYISLTDGTISDDSDIWLFGGQKVYKNFFNQKKHVKQFTSGDIRQFFKLSRHQLILLALLTGSDYTTGLTGVGPVTAMEILAAFPTEINDGENLAADSLARGLRNFQEWYHQGRPTGPGKAILRNKLKDLKLHEGFPSLPVIEAYLHPAVDLSREKFSWALPDVDKLREFAREKFGWTKLKTDEILLPVMNKLSERISQKSLHSYFEVKVKLPATDGKLSKRVEKAVRRFGIEGSHSNEEDDPPVKKAKKKSVSVLQTAKEGSKVPVQRGRGRGRGRGIVSLPSDQPSKITSQTSMALEPCTSSEAIPQREKDRLNALKNKLKAIELFRTSKKGLDPPRKYRQPKRKELATAELSESDDD